ncbi:DNA-binding response regulator [Pacificispira sp.]|uniref:DNA-binding response regulator n=1 Tax=Pacificispira sp. TaxID=2888761 RepID=UPI003B518D6B
MVTKPKIAFVDDEPKLLSSLRRALRDRREDWDMAFHDDPQAALDLFRDDPPKVAVIDIKMPGMNGLELVRRIAEEELGTRCIILSGSTDFDVAVASINDGNVFRYYVKPCAMADLIAGIEAALVSRTRRSGDDPNTPVGGEAEAETLSSAALDLIRHGVIVAGPDGHVLFANQSAGRLLSGDAGLSLDAHGICRAWRMEDTERLHTAMARALAEGETSALTLEQPEADMPIRVTVVPHPDSGTTGARRVCLFLFAENDAQAPPAKLLMQMFGLTVSESRLAAAMARGLSLEEAAETCGVTKASARSYLKNIFAKLGVSRQAELVRTILVSLPPPAT